MKEREPRLTNEAGQPYTGREGMDPNQREGEPGPTPVPPDEDTQRANEADAAARNILASMTQEQRNALVKQVMEQVLGGGAEGVATEDSPLKRKERNVKFLTNRAERDKYFDHFFSLVDATPHDFFGNVWNRNLNRIYAYDNFIELISTGAVGDLREMGISWTDLKVDERNEVAVGRFREELQGDLARYQAERKLREHLHDVNAALYLPSLKAKQLYEHMQQFGSEEADLAWRTPGVLQMARIYEQVLREDMAKYDGYLRPEAVLGYVDSVQNGEGDPVINKVERAEVEKETRQRFKDMVARGDVVVRNQQGQAVSVRDFQEWQIDKVFTMAKGMSIVNLRLISIASESKLPPKSAVYTSLFLQDIISTFSPFVHLEGKFQIGGKAITPYLYKSEAAKKTLGMFTQWDPNTLKDTLHKFEKDGFQAILDSPEFFYIKKLNPNRCGDIFTWLSWRANEDGSVPSMIQRFVVRGEERMKRRWSSNHAGSPPPDVYDAFIKLPAYEVPSDTPSDKKSEAEKALQEQMERDWRTSYPGAPSIADYKKHIGEYADWIGTGLRFEKLRGNLEKLDPYKSWEEQKNALERGNEDQRKIYADMVKADKILERMVNLQPHRLLLKSETIRKRLGIDKNDIKRIMKNLSIAEETVLRNREDFLKNGGTFASASLDFNVIPESERQEAKDFAASLKKDFDENRNLYYEEFVFRREYKHGFVLWDGDAPKDEFNFTALGQPGVVRRARDNAAQEDAWTEEIKLLDGLEHVRSVGDLVKALEAMHKKVDDYDKGKAQLATYEKAEAFAQFFAEASFTKLPVVGLIEKTFGDHVSMAKIVFGPEAPAWGSLELKNFFHELHARDYITKEQFGKLSNKFATTPDVAVDFGVTWAQLVSLALALYLISKLFKEK